MGTAFGQFVKRRLAELGLSQRDLAHQVGLSHGTINKIINASHEAPPPPLGSGLERWIKALQISAQDQHYFCDLAALVYIPHAVRPRWEKWYQAHHNLFEHDLESANTLTQRVADGTPHPYNKTT